MSRLKDLFRRTTNVQEPETEESKISGEEMPASENAPSVPEGLWVKCFPSAENSSTRKTL